VDDFKRARAQLALELTYVGDVRAYFKALAKPYDNTIRDAFNTSTGIADRLEAELKVAKERAEARANWFELVKGLLSFAGGFEGAIADKAIKEVFNVVLEVSASAMETSAFAYEGEWDGSRDGSEEEIEQDARLTADELGKELQLEAEASVATFKRMGNAIVSDYDKLEELALHAQCQQVNNGCDDKRLDCAQKPGGCQDFREYAVPGGEAVKASAMARVALERTIYRQLVTLSSHFPVWDTGVTRNPVPLKYLDCGQFPSVTHPFYNAPRQTWTTSLEELDPAGKRSRRRVLIMVARNQYSFSWPSPILLEKMFDPVDEGGLGMAPLDVMRNPRGEYEPAVPCRWKYPTGATRLNGEAVLRDEPQP
jgi:hypothetical protein